MRLGIVNKYLKHTCGSEAGQPLNAVEPGVKSMSGDVSILHGNKS